MKVNFLLPGYSRVPIGGYTVVLQYANRLAADGIDVTVLYAVELLVEKAMHPSLADRWRMFKKPISKKRGKRYSAAKWFPLNPGVQEKLLPNFKEKHIQDADVIFATAWETTFWVNSYSAAKGRKFYLIQHYETWNTTPQEVDKSWCYPFTKIVIARWLQAHATALGQPSILIYNGLDFEKFYIEIPITDRNPLQVLMLYHPFEWKGSATGLAALQLVRANIPNLQVTLFSTAERPMELPEWIAFHRNPANLKALYNEAAIFISPSKGEGWALPPAEAMQCGCAAVLTAIGGHMDYGEDGKDLLLVPPDDAVAMANATIDLIHNHQQRVSIAVNGNMAIQQFTWDKAYTKFKATILG